MSDFRAVDLHGDILLDVLDRRHQGEQRVLETHHLASLKTGRVQVQVLPIYIMSEYLPESALRIAMRTLAALYQEVAESPEHFALVKTREELRRARSEGKIALILAFEGADPLDRDVDLVRLFYQLGLRMIGLTWNRANQYAQGLAEDTGAGVTAVGRELLRRMAELGIILDVSHLSQSSFWSALDHFDGPVVASHCNALAVSGHPRNLTDDQMRAIAERGGLIGLNFVPRFVGGANLLDGLVRQAAYIRDRVGLSHLALGPDFMNYLRNINESPQQRLVGPEDPEMQPETALPDVTLFPQLWQKFLDSGWSLEEAGALFYDNAWRYLQQWLPGE